MAKVRTYQEVLKFFEGVGLYFIPIPIAGSPFAASPFPYLIIDGESFSFRRFCLIEEIFEEEYAAYCEWANEKLAQRGKIGIRVVFQLRMLRLLKTESNLVDKCPAT